MINQTNFMAITREMNNWCLWYCFSYFIPYIKKSHNQKFLTADIWHCGRNCYSVFRLVVVTLYIDKISSIRGSSYSTEIRAPFQYSIRRLIGRSREVSKSRDLYSKLSDRSERGACQISKQCDNINYQSRGFETSRDLIIRSFIGYWNGPQDMDM